MTLFKRIARPMTALVLAVASLPAMAALAPFKADYRASYMGVVADGSMQLERSGDNWRYTVQVRNQLADLRQSTEFDTAGGHYRPLRSQDSANLVFKRRSVNGHYDWRANQARWDGDVKTERRGPIALQPGDMDALLINLAIVRDLAAGKPLQYRMVEEGRTKQMRYTNAGNETLQLDGKSVPVTRLSYVDGNKELIAWVSSQYPVPLRLLQRKDGRDELDLTIRAVQ